MSIKNIVKFHKPENPKAFFRSFLPGIRAKLIVFTISLLFTFGVVSFSYFLIKQNEWIQEGFQKEIQAPLSYINTLTLDMENLADTMVLIEDMKSRIRSKEKELSNKRKRIVSKSTRSEYFGLVNKEKLNVSYRDTYFSQYLSTSAIEDLTVKVKAQFRDERGILISDRWFSYMQSIAGRVATHQAVVDSLEWKPEKTDREIRILNARKRYLSLEMRKLRLQIQKFFRNRNRYSVEEMGFNPRNIRIQSFDREKNLFLDTGRLIDSSTFSSRRLLTLPEFKEDRDSLLEFSPQELILGDSEKEKEYNIGKNHYEIITRPFFKNSILTERSKLLLADIQKGNSEWMEYLREDIAIAHEFSDLIEELQLRREELFEKNIPPYKDRIYQGLYGKYRALMKKRRNVFLKLHPYPTLDADRRAKVSETIQEYEKNKEDLEKRIQATLKVSEEKEKSGEEDAAERLKKEADDLGSDLEALNEELAELNVRLHSWIDFPKLKLHEAYRNLRDASLKSHIMLPYQNDSLLYEKFLRDNSFFFAEQRRWSHIRNWIMGGRSESSIPKLFIPRRGNVPIFENGILFRSRTEAEDYMWFLDSTPLYSYPDTRGSLSHILLYQNLAGSNMIILDRTDSVQETKSSLIRLLQIATGIGFFFIMIAVIASNYAVRKIRTISEATNDVADGNLDVEFPDTGWDEIGKLGRTLNHMVEGLREREELRGELEAAEEIQKRLLPEKLPEVPGLEFGGFYKAMHGVGGDYYDFIEMEDRIYLVIGDVSSHGVGPALVMAVLRSQLHSLVRRGAKDPKQILFELNRFLYDETPDTIFVTLFLGVFMKSSSTLVYASAGHNKPIVYRKKDNVCKHLKAGGLPLGMDENEFFESTIEARKTILEPGDFFFQFTDGVNEAMDSERNQYGMERLYKAILTRKNAPSQDILKSIIRDVENFTGKKIIQPGPSELNDDIAMIGLRVLG